MRTWIGIAVAAAVLAGAPSTRGPALARGQGEMEGADARLHAVVRELMTQLYTGTQGIVPGLPRDEAIALSSAASNVAGEYTFALTETPYKPKTAVPGVLQFFLGSKDKGVDEVTAILSPGPYDVAAMGKLVAQAGARLGLELQPDGDAPNSYFDFRDAGRNLWVGLGKGVIVVEVDQPDEE